MSFLRPVLIAPVLLAVTGVQLPALAEQAMPILSPQTVADASHRHQHHSKTSPSDHPHSLLNVPANRPAPTVQLVLHPDSVKGWNLEIQVENFRFAPERVNTASQVTEGHGHLYIDGKKITRLYSHWFYLPDLNAGAQIRVSLHANGHEALAVNNRPVEATTTLQVAGHSHP